MYHCINTKIVASGPITTWQIEREKVDAVTDFIFLGSKITVAAVKLRRFDKPRQHIKKQRHHFADKHP